MRVLEPILVSVIMPVWNGEQFLAEAIESVLAQDRRPLELIVVDDGSEDASVAVASRHPEVRLLHKPHSGIADTVNLGVAAAQGSLLAFLDADDRWRPGKLAAQCALLAAHPSVDGVFGYEHRFLQGPVAGVSAPLYDAPGYTKSSLLIRRSAFDRVGPFDGSLPSGDFVDWWGRAQEAGIVTRLLPEVVYERRVHRNNHGMLQRELQHASYVRLLKRLLDRRRGGRVA